MKERFEEPSLSGGERLAQRSIQLLQWNVWHRSSAESITTHIRQIEANKGPVDILSLQEIPLFDWSKPNEVAQQIADELGMDYYFEPCGYNGFYRPTREDRVVMDGIGIFSRFPIVDGSKRSHVLSEGRGGPDLYRDRHLIRRLLTTDVEVPGRTEPLRVGTFHLSISTQFPWRRMKEARLLAELLKDCDIVGGDANAKPASRYAKTLFEALPRQDDKTDTPTFYREFGPFKAGPFSFSIPSSRRLDYVVGNPEFQVEHAEVLEELGPSDHKPIIIKAKV